MTNLKQWWRVCRIKLSRWEYWNSYLVCIPVLPYLLLLWIRARSVFFFNAANPGIAYGGFLMESKWKIHTDAPEGFFPPTVCISPFQPFEEVREALVSRFHFPVIAKPDIGSKGRGVAIIKNMAQLQQYHAHCPVNWLIQEKINYPMEAGIFYVRMPGETKGCITGIVQKEYIKVTGNGNNTLLQLLLQNPRHVLQVKALERILGTEAMQVIIPDGESRTVLDIGNHARGSLFVNASCRITPLLTNTIDQLCQQFKGFYFGRLDLRFESWEALEKGASFAVIELNGSGSEPTHIYDPATSIFAAWKEICRHWQLTCEISRRNHRSGIAYLNWKEGMTLFANNAAMDKKLARFQAV